MKYNRALVFNKKSLITMGIAFIGMMFVTPNLQANRNEAGAAIDLSGSHSGKIEIPRPGRGYDSDATTTYEIDIAFQKLKGFCNSYLAIVFSYDELMKPDQAMIYRVDHLEGNQFQMTPFNVTSDGYVGIDDADPSLILEVTPNDSKQYLKISSANSENKRGLQNLAIKSLGKHDAYVQWSRLKAGTYEGNGAEIQFSAIESDFTGSASVSKVRGFGSSGPHVVQEKLPGVYTFRPVQYKATGKDVKVFPSSVGVFIKYRGREALLLISPKGDSVVPLEYKR